MHFHNDICNIDCDPIWNVEANSISQDVRAALVTDTIVQDAVFFKMRLQVRQQTFCYILLPLAPYKIITAYFESEYSAK